MTLQGDLLEDAVLAVEVCPVMMIVWRSHAPIREDASIERLDRTGYSRRARLTGPRDWDGRVRFAVGSLDHLVGFPARDHPGSCGEDVRALTNVRVGERHQRTHIVLPAKRLTISSGSGTDGIIVQ
eukprot:COSAG02_NODE_668_length_18685_cov_185.638976_9_plen_126_part_00